MPDETPKPSAPESIPPKHPGLDLGPGVGINVTQDMATPERSLPPAKIVLIALAGLAVVLAIYGFVGRAKPQGAGAIDNIAVVEVPNQNSVLVALTVTLHNNGEKPLWIHNIEGKLKTPQQEYSDDAASADFAVIDDADGTDEGSCAATPATQFIAISATPMSKAPIIYLSRGGGRADYRIFVRSKRMSEREAAALIVGAHGKPAQLALNAS